MVDQVSHERFIFLLNRVLVDPRKQPNDASAQEA
jgi:hypothetical protein